MIEYDIHTETNEEKTKIATAIHESLVGNTDYILNHIVVNMDEDCLIHVAIFDDSETKMILTPTIRVRI